MKLRKCIMAISAITAVISGFAAANVKDGIDWWEYTRPFLAVWIIATLVVLFLHNINYVRRVFYPAFVCLSAWLYKYQIVMTKFTRDTYRVYKYNSKSFKKLFGYTQDLFDTMYM